MRYCFLPAGCSYDPATPPNGGCCYQNCGPQCSWETSCPAASNDCHIGGTCQNDGSCSAETQRANGMRCFSVPSGRCFNGECVATNSSSSQTTETASSFTEAPESSTESPSADFSLTTQSSLDTTTATATSWSFAQLLLTANTAASACYIGLMDDSSCNNEGGVYLVPTSWIQNHPGGADAIKSRCGHVSYSWDSFSGSHNTFRTNIIDHSNIQVNGHTIEFVGVLDCSSDENLSYRCMARSDAVETSVCNAVNWACTSGGVDCSDIDNTQSCTERANLVYDRYYRANTRSTCCFGADDGLSGCTAQLVIFTETTTAAPIAATTSAVAPSITSAPIAATTSAFAPSITSAPTPSTTSISQTTIAIIDDGGGDDATESSSDSTFILLGSIVGGLLFFIGVLTLGWCICKRSAMKNPPVGVISSSGTTTGVELDDYEL